MLQLLDNHRQHLKRGKDVTQLTPRRVAGAIRFHSSGKFSAITGKLHLGANGSLGGALSRRWGR